LACWEPDLPFLENLRFKTGFVVLVGSALILAPAPESTASPPAACRMSTADRTWLLGALANWRSSERDILKIGAQPLPMIMTADERCLYTLPAGQAILR
jgi:hypothetical protein